MHDIQKYMNHFLVSIFHLVLQRVEKNFDKTLFSNFFLKFLQVFLKKYQPKL